MRTIFKGGTSLSRIFGLIERFSEDVDLLIGFPEGDVSVGARDRVLKGILAAVAVHLRIDAADAVPEGSATTGVKRNMRFRYPELGYESTESISSGVLLEMGCRGGTFPTQNRTLRSMVAEHAIDVLGETADTWEELASVDIEVLAPERTLLEKLALLHDAAARASDDGGQERFARVGRHVYDVHQLLGDEHVRTVLAQAGPAGVGTLCADIERHSETAGLSFTPRPAGGFGASPLLQSGTALYPVLERAYRDAIALVYGEHPTLAECLDSIRTYSELL